MEKQLFSILSDFKKIKFLKDEDKIICTNFYQFFINNYKKYNTFNDLINIFLYYNKNSNIYDIVNVLNNIFNIEIKIDNNVVLNELKRYNFIKNYKLTKNKILNFYMYKYEKIKKGYFIVYLKWFDNYIILKDIYSNKILKLYLDNDLIEYIMIGDILKLTIVKDKKSYWQILNILDFYQDKLNYNLYRLKKL